VFLTATLPVGIMRRFSDRLLLVNPVIIRSLTVRKNLTYGVVRAQGPDVVGFGITEVRKAMERVPLFVGDEKARAIVYCRTKEEVRRVAEELSCSMYYADSGTEEEKAEVLSGWMRGNSRIIAATTAFTEGIDYRYVRVVFYIGAPESAIEFVQGVGRRGRDGRGCLCCVILPNGWTFRIRGRNGELLDEDAMTIEWFLNSPRCRVLSLSLFLNGKAQYCDEIEYACDRCTRKGLVGEDEARAEVGAYVSRCTDEHNVGIQIGEELDAGAQQLQAYKREQEERQHNFIWHLDVVRGGCLICLTMKKREGLRHNLDECRSKEKRSFFQAKKRATEGGRGWIAGFKACFYCGLPQRLCTKQGKGGC